MAWRPTLALVVAAATGATLLLLAVALHRPDLLAIAAPVVAGLALNLLDRPSAPVRARLACAPRTLLEDQQGRLQLIVDTGPQADLVLAQWQLGRALAVPGSEHVAAAPRGGRAVIDRPLHALRWGRTSVGTARVTAVAAQGMLRQDVLTRTIELRVLPLREQFRSLVPLPRPTGIVGAHRSRRTGEGIDPAGVRPFAAGDRLRRINWRVSLRSGDLHVTTTTADRDSLIMIVLDTAVDAPGTEGSSLDRAVHAAAALAEHYLRAGDRVGLLDLARPYRPVRAAAGRAHLDRVVEALLDVDVSDPVADVPLTALLARLAPGGLVLLMSALLGAARPERALELARSGHQVVLVDTLGEPTRDTSERPWSAPARRLQLLQRQHDIDRLGESGVPVVGWRGPGSLDEVLRSLQRSAAAPRVRR